jgi:hypothetical protein
LPRLFGETTHITFDEREALGRLFDALDRLKKPEYFLSARHPNVELIHGSRVVFSGNAEPIERSTSLSSSDPQGGSPMPYKILTVLTAVFLTVPALHAATISTNGYCPNYVTGPAVTVVLSATVCGAGGSITAADGAYSSTISFDVAADGLNIEASAGSLPITLAVGGNGWGEMTVTYTDTVQLSSVWETEYYSGNAGALQFSVYCGAGACEIPGINETQTFTSSPILVYNGEQVSLGTGVNIDAEVFLIAIDGTLSSSASISIAQAVPEPSAFWPGLALLIAAGVRKVAGRIA